MSNSFFERLTARLASLVATVSQSVSSAASGSQGSQAAPGMRLPTELLLSNLNPAGDDGLDAEQINPIQPDASIGTVLRGYMERLRLNGSSEGDPFTIEQVTSAGLSDPFDAANPPRGLPPGSRFIEAHPLVYTINGVAPPPPGLVLGRMIPDPLPLRKYTLSYTNPDYVPRMIVKRAATER